MPGTDAPSSAGSPRLVEAVLDFICSGNLLPREALRALLVDEVAAGGPAAIDELRARLSMDTGWDYFPPNPLVRRIHHVLADRFLRPGSGVGGREHLEAMRPVPHVIFANHLSYSDANVIEILLHRDGLTHVADRLTALAGPKVFTDRARRFSSLCFGTIKVPQSADVASDEAVLGAREVARAARRAIDVARARLRGGDTLLLFGEGTRSRTREMQRLLPGVTRYLEEPQTMVVPMGVTGSDELFPIDGTGVRATVLRVTAGAPIEAAALLTAADGDPRLVVDAIGLAVARMLPESHRGVYADERAHADAWRLLQRASGASYGTV